MQVYRIVWYLNQLTPALEGMEDAVTDMSPVMQEIADYLFAITRERFDRGVAPDGTPWAPKKATTIEAHRRREGLKKNPRDTRPLFGPSGRLHSQLFPEADYNSAGVFTNVPYAAVHQFGARKGSFGSYSDTDKNGHPFAGVSPWGDIPARPFIGLSADNEEDIRQTLIEYVLREAFNAAR